MVVLLVLGLLKSERSVKTLPTGTIDTEQNSKKRPTDCIKISKFRSLKNNKNVKT